MVVGFLSNIAERAPRGDMETSPLQFLMCGACFSGNQPRETPYLGWHLVPPNLFPGGELATSILLHLLNI